MRAGEEGVERSVSTFQRLDAFRSWVSTRLTKPIEQQRHKQDRSPPMLISDGGPEQRGEELPKANDEQKGGSDRRNERVDVARRLT